MLIENNNFKIDEIKNLYNYFTKLDNLYYTKDLNDILISILYCIQIYHPIIPTLDKYFRGENKFEFFFYIIYEVYKKENEFNKKLNKLEKELKEEKNKEKIFEIKKNNELTEKINKLIEELKEEKNKNKELDKIIKDFKNELNNEIKKNKDLQEETEITKRLYEQKTSTKELYQSILDKDKEIKELNKKLSRFPFELKEGEILMSLIIQSADQKIHHSFICKNTDLFNKVEGKLYELYPEYSENDNFFTCNGKKINRFKNLDDNKIKDGDIIILNVLE